MRRRSVAAAAVAAAGLLLLGCSALLGPAAARCLVVTGGTCVDERLTARASGYVSSIDSETPGIPIYYVEFEVAGTRVQAKVANWPAAPGGPANGPRVGATVAVAYDPAAPAAHVTDAAALAALADDPPPGPGPAALAARWAGGVLLVLALVYAAAAGLRGRLRRPDIRSAPGGTS